MAGVDVIARLLAGGGKWELWNRLKPSEAFLGLSPASWPANPVPPILA